MSRIAALVACVVVASSAFAADPPGDAAAALERKLVGAWVGGPCAGELDLRADGSYERRHFSPGGHRLSGSWRVRWDALPPTLVLTCETSDDPDRIGTTSEAKLVGLDDESLVYRVPGGAAVRYARADE